MELIQRYHAQPGHTVETLERWRTADGRTSYEVMVEETSALSRESRILDLACGNGHLLGLLAQRDLHDGVGVDLSPEELADARERLGPRVELHCADARALPLRDESVDVVLCHMALMLMAPVEPVLAEIVRVLRPGGRFVAIVNRYLEDPVNECFRRWLHRTTAEHGLARLRLGDARTLSIAGLKGLIDSSGLRAESLVIHDFEVQLRATPEVLWASLRSSYDVFQLPEAARAVLEQRVRRAWEPLRDGEGMLPCALGMRLLRCQR